jgi:hypothetical protein
MVYKKKQLLLITIRHYWLAVEVHVSGYQGSDDQQGKQKA